MIPNTGFEIEGFNFNSMYQTEVTLFKTHANSEWDSISRNRHAYHLHHGKRSLQAHRVEISSKANDARELHRLLFVVERVGGRALMPDLNASEPVHVGTGGVWDRVANNEARARPIWPDADVAQLQLRAERVGAERGSRNRDAGECLRMHHCEA